MSKRGKMSINYDTIAQKHGISESAVRHLAQAIVQGNGTQAQFNHPELGGSGQWMPRMVMIGDMFNNKLKAKVESLCHELAAAYQDGQIKPLSTMQTMQTQWWSADLKKPSIAGEQNNLRYAYFPDEGRLIIEHNTQETMYNTSPHTITGVSQQQTSGHMMLVFQTQSGQMLTIQDFSIIQS